MNEPPVCPCVCLFGDETTTTTTIKRSNIQNEKFWRKKGPCVFLNKKMMFESRIKT